MKTRKVYDQLPNLYYRPEFEQCPNCGVPLTRSHTAWRKTITGMKGSAKVYNQAYRCRDEEMCGDPSRVYRSIYADGLSLPYYTYSLDVIVYIGQARLRQHQTIPEIHKALNHMTPAVSMSERVFGNSEHLIFYVNFMTSNLIYVNSAMVPFKAKPRQTTTWNLSAP